MVENILSSVKLEAGKHNTTNIQYKKINRSSLEFYVWAMLSHNRIDYERGTCMSPLSYNLSIQKTAMAWGFPLPFQVLIKKPKSKY